jgi:hypothetical protein
MGWLAMLVGLQPCLVGGSLSLALDVDSVHWAVAPTPL